MTKDTPLHRVAAKHPRLFGGKFPEWSDLPAGWEALVDAMCARQEGELSD
jgi:hypothetical protein